MAWSIGCSIECSCCSFWAIKDWVVDRIEWAEVGDRIQFEQNVLSWLDSFSTPGSVFHWIWTWLTFSPFFIIFDESDSLMTFFIRSDMEKKEKDVLFFWTYTQRYSAPGSFSFNVDVDDWALLNGSLNRYGQRRCRVNYRNFGQLATRCASLDVESSIRWPKKNQIAVGGSFVCLFVCFLNEIDCIDYHWFNDGEERFHVGAIDQAISFWRMSSGRWYSPSGALINGRHQRRLLTIWSTWTIRPVGLRCDVLPFYEFRPGSKALHHHHHCVCVCVCVCVCTPFVVSFFILSVVVPWWTRSQGMKKNRDGFRLCFVFVCLFVRLFFIRFAARDDPLSYPSAYCGCRGFGCCRCCCCNTCPEATGHVVYWNVLCWWFEFKKKKNRNNVFVERIQAGAAVECRLTTTGQYFRFLKMQSEIHKMRKRNSFIVNQFLREC